jgi:hypothetical protein
MEFKMKTILFALIIGISGPALAQTYTLFNVVPGDSTGTHRIDSTGRVLGTSAPSGGYVRDVSGSITLVNIPGAANTNPQSFVGAASIAGYYADASGNDHGFFGPIGGPYTRFDVAGAVSTYVAAGNVAGQLTGSWYDAATKAHGYLRNPDGTVEQLSAPGWAETVPNSINSLGQICGSVMDSSGVVHGFVRSSTGVFTIYNFPFNSIITVLNYINDAGQVAGYYWGGGNKGYRGYLRDPSGVFTDFVVSGNTYVSDISPTGAIVGWTGSLAHHGAYLRRTDGTYARFSIPGGPTVSVASSINSSGEIAGTCSGCAGNVRQTGVIVTGLQ